MKIILFVFFAAFITTVYGATQHLVLCGTEEPALETFYQEKLTDIQGDGDEAQRVQVDIYTGLETGKTFPRFTVSGDEGELQISAVYQHHHAVVKSGEYGLYLQSSKVKGSKDEDIYFKVNDDGVLMGNDGEEGWKKLCFSNEYGIHLESDQDPHQRVYLTLHGKNVVVSEVPVPVKKEKEHKKKEHKKKEHKSDEDEVVRVDTLGTESSKSDEGSEGTDEDQRKKEKPVLKKPSSKERRQVQKEKEKDPIVDVPQHHHLPPVHHVGNQHQPPKSQKEAPKLKDNSEGTDENSKDEELVVDSRKGEKYQKDTTTEHPEYEDNEREVARKKRHDTSILDKILGWPLLVIVISILVLLNPLNLSFLEFKK